MIGTLQLRLREQTVIFRQRVGGGVVPVERQPELGRGRPDAISNPFQVQRVDETLLDDEPVRLEMLNFFRGELDLPAAWQL